MKKLYYFSYGSNLLLERIEERVGEVIEKGTYILKEWGFRFNCGYQAYSFANIIQAQGEEVEGVLYELTDVQIKTLDRYEGYPYNYEKRYFTINDDTIGYTYVSVSYTFKSEAKPLLNYLNLLIEGCLQNNLIKTFETLLKYKEDNYVLRSNKHKFASIEEREEYIQKQKEYSQWRRGHYLTKRNNYHSEYV